MIRRLIPICLLVAIVFQARSPGAEDVYSQEKCSLCHIRQSVFFDAKLLSREAALDFGEERLCMSCHDGTVRDNRSHLWRGSQHPAAGGRSEKVCSRCHSPHSQGGWDVLAGTAVSLTRGGSAVCTGCHRDRGISAGGVHSAGFTDGGCRECHRAHGGVGKSLLREGKGTLCLRCHSLQEEGRAGGHPVSTSEEDPGKRLPECTACHPAHGSGATVKEMSLSGCRGCHPASYPNGKGGGNGHEGGSDCLLCHVFHRKNAEDGRAFRGREIRAGILCGKCHGGYQAASASIGKSKGTHTNVFTNGSEGVCFRCHRIHGETGASSLLRSSKEYFCLECHEGQNTIRETSGIALSHPVFERVGKGRLSVISASKKRPLGPAGEIVCRTCHAVHRAGPDTPLLAPGMERGESCTVCHETMKGISHGKSGKAAGNASCETCHPVHGKKGQGENPWQKLCSDCHPRKSQHRLGMEDRFNTRPGNLPTFDERGRKAAFGGISCPTCHAPHGRPAAKRMLRKDYSPSGFLCTACHRQEENVALTPHDLRGIAGNGVCEPCHIPHGGGKPWMSGVQPGTGEPTEETCRACHKEKGLGTAVPREGHPTGLIVPRPIPDDFPLFGTDGERGRKGVISCPTCHEVHGTGIIPVGKGTGKLLRLSREAGPAEPGAGSHCLPCHKGSETSHGKADCLRCHPPHRGKKPVEECGSCHAVEPAGTAKRHETAGNKCDACHRIHSYGREPQTSVEKCLSCHQKERRILGTPHAGIGGGCRPCHPAHSDAAKPVTKRHAWEDPFRPDLACLRCHGEDGAAPAPKWTEHPKNRKNVPTSYGATVTIETPIIMIGRFQESGRPLFPLFDESGKPGPSGRAGCLTCHDPHAGSVSGAGDGSPNRYLRDPSGVFLAEVCAPCHRGDAAERAKNFHLMQRKAE